MENNKNNNKNNINKRKKKKFKAWKVILIMIILVVLIAISAVVGVVMAFVNTAPQINLDSFTNLAQTTKIYDKDGNYIENFHGIENRTYVTLPNINKYTQDAFISIEDERFREHPGVDIKRIFGALWADLRSGSLEQGASTITQQLVRNIMLTQKKEWSRKIQEAYLAIKLEDKLSKDMILEYYLNTIFLGGSAYGVQAASEYYFGKNASDLTIAESALIAGITQSPNIYNPYLNVNTPDVYKERQLTVLSTMLKNNYINQEEFNSAKEEMESQKFDSKATVNNTQLKYQWFIESAIDSVMADLKLKYQYTDQEIQQKIYTGGLKIYTTIDTNIQDVVDKIANDPKYYPTLYKDIATWGKDNTIQPQVGICISDYKTGEVRALLGGRGEQPLRALNRAVDVPRQPGSSMKPLAVYAPAFDMGYSPSSVLDDTPLSSEMAQAAGWKEDEYPLNYEKTFDGFYILRDAIKKSKNIIAVKLMLQITPRKSVDYLKKFNLSYLVTTPDKNGNTDVVTSIALGGMTNGVTPVEMASAYGVFGNNGVYTEPILYSKVLDSEDNVILEKKPEKHKVVSAEAAYLMVDTLKGVINNGTGTKAKFSSMPSAGKTGTTNELADAYFVGITPYYSGAIWVGHDKPSLGIKGSEFGKDKNSSKSLSSGDSAWMWGDIMKAIHTDLPIIDFEKPTKIVTATVCKDSGKLATDLCRNDPRGSREITDIFAEGTVPTDFCSVHVELPIDTSNGKIATEFCPIELIKKIIFIKRENPVDNSVADFIYQAPTEYCDLHKSKIVITPTPIKPPVPTTTPTTP